MAAVASVLDSVATIVSLLDSVKTVDSNLDSLDFVVTNFVGSNKHTNSQFCSSQDHNRQRMHRDKVFNTHSSDFRF